MKRHRLYFTPSNQTVWGLEGQSLLETARENGIYLFSDCGGRGRCGGCRVRVLNGAVHPLTESELRLLSPYEQEQGFRLACQTHLLGDMEVWVPEEHLLDPDPTPKDFAGGLKGLDPALKRFRILRESNRGKPVFTPEGIAAWLQEQYGLNGVTIDPGLAREFKTNSHPHGNPCYSVVVWMEKELVALQTGETDPLLGLALDIGTTTAALYLCDLENGNILLRAAVTNPQLRFGADIISRIAYCRTHPGQGAKTLQKELLSAVNGLIQRMTERLGFSPNHILEAVVVGNTVMHHLFLGLSPEGLGTPPFAPAIQGAVDVKAALLGLNIHPFGNVHVFPVLAGFIGADHLALLLSQEPHLAEEPMLILDLGTNGEIVLGDRQRLLSCSCATGPAFEGGHISCGLRAVPGAVARVRFPFGPHRPDYQVIGRKGWASEHPPGTMRPAGVCGSGLIDLAAQLLHQGVIKPTGPSWNPIAVLVYESVPTGWWNTCWFPEGKRPPAGTWS